MEPMSIDTISLMGSGVVPVFLYLDPGTGAMIVSALVGIAVTLGMACKGFWYKAIRLIGKKKKDETKKE